MNIREKYTLLFEKATSPRSVDLGQPFTFQFDRHCKQCRAGLGLPLPQMRREYKLILKRGYCSEHCSDLGRNKSKTVVSASSSQHGRKQDMHIIEQAALCALIVHRSEKKLTHMQKLVLAAERSCRMLSAKLRFLEVHSGEKFYPNKYYRLVDSVQKLL
jgi:hypothetical protein